MLEVKESTLATLVATYCFTMRNLLRRPRPKNRRPKGHDTPKWARTGYFRATKSTQCSEERRTSGSIDPPRRKEPPDSHAQREGAKPEGETNTTGNPARNE